MRLRSTVLLHPVHTPLCGESSAADAWATIRCMPCTRHPPAPQSKCYPETILRSCSQVASCSPWPSSQFCWRLWTHIAPGHAVPCYRRIIPSPDAHAILPQVATRRRHRRNATCNDMLEWCSSIGLRKCDSFDSVLSRWLVHRLVFETEL